jgi:hypothetical protein
VNGEEEKRTGREKDQKRSSNFANKLFFFTLKEFYIKSFFPLK